MKKETTMFERVPEGKRATDFRHAPLDPIAWVHGNAYVNRSSDPPMLSDSDAPYYPEGAGVSFPSLHTDEGLGGRMKRRDLDKKARREGRNAKYSMGAW